MLMTGREVETNQPTTTTTPTATPTQCGIRAAFMRQASMHAPSMHHTMYRGRGGRHYSQPYTHVFMQLYTGGDAGQRVRHLPRWILLRHPDSCADRVPGGSAAGFADRTGGEHGQKTTMHATAWRRTSGVRACVPYESCTCPGTCARKGRH